MNAHIDLDLGIAAEVVSPGTQLPSLEHDFDLVNQVLASEVAAVLDEIDELSPVLAEMYDVFQKFESAVVDTMLDVSRKEAWDFATELALLDPVEQEAAIAKRDIEVARVGQEIITPPSAIAHLAGAVGLLECRDEVKIIETLNEQANAKV